MTQLSSRFLSVIFIILLPLDALAQGSYRNLDPEDRSGELSLGFSLRPQTSPYLGEDYRRDWQPMFIYTGETFFFNTNEAGWHLIDNDDWQLDLYAGYFYGGYNEHSIFWSETGRDDDDALDGMSRRDAWESGFALTRKTDYGRFKLDLNADISGAHEGYTASAEWSKVFRFNRWQVEPWFAYQLFNDDKSNYYFGVREDEATDTRNAYKIDEATDNWEIGTAFRYQAAQHHYFGLNLYYTIYDNKILDSPIVEESTILTANINYRYEFNDLSNPGPDGDVYNFFFNNPNPWSMRVAYGYTTDSSFMDIVRGEFERNDDGTSMGSVFLSRQLTERFMWLPIEGWAQAGVARRFENDIQGDFNEYVFAFKAYFTKFPWSNTVKTRFGFAEGLSYATKVPAVEQRRNDDRDRNTSHLLNYLDYSWDVSIGDIFRQKDLKDCFFGFSIHHRSGIFASSDLYGNVNGGSNVNTLYVECIRS
ncbi:hypothetical protein SIN8267_00821 [Sinobacterium norvegicum]|uniref:MipA/OmpV family protein n=1 Tax=Sinobacterium norvegicum TaxID=1641715 RepID=A0ABM9ACK7_9GAMM|nr:MipA/OmpV family protein [Sinobacterium norvegicum]CAH0990726.1 hypothetical protein SIN8267_00821 [Sinobacterium norvegicum]